MSLHVLCSDKKFQVDVLSGQIDEPHNEEYANKELGKKSSGQTHYQKIIVIRCR